MQSWAPSLLDTLVLSIIAAEGASQTPWKRSQRHAFAAKVNHLLGCVSSQQSQGRKPSNFLQLDLLQAGGWTGDLQRSLPPTGESSRDLRSQLMSEEEGPLAICSRDHHLPGGLCNCYKSWCVHAHKGTHSGNRVKEESSNSGSKLSP